MKNMDAMLGSDEYTKIREGERVRERERERGRKREERERVN